jgi:hypothetical protein
VGRDEIDLVIDYQPPGITGLPPLVLRAGDSRGHGDVTFTYTSPDQPVDPRGRRLADGPRSGDGPGGGRWPDVGAGTAGLGYGGGRGGEHSGPGHIRSEYGPEGGDWRRRGPDDATAFLEDG